MSKTNNNSENRKEDIIGAWTEDKLQLLYKYLQAYSTIMNRQKKWLKAYHYIDAFAGSGKPKAKSDLERYIDGSPRLALQCIPKFDYYWFVELESWRTEKLDELKREFPISRINILQGDCNELLVNTIVPKISYKNKERGLVFLDPFGLQVELKTVEALASEKTFDVFVNFPLMAITRQLKHDERPSGQIKALIDKILGNTEWIDYLYKQSPQLNLFGEPDLERNVIRAEWLARIYSEKISEFFAYVSNPVIMRNTKNSPLYALFLMSHNKTGVNIANDIFGRFERLRNLN